MEKAKCHECGGEAPGCGHAVNGAAKPGRVKPPPPPELADWVATPTPPEELERMRREFNEEEWLAALREVERTGGVTFEEIIVKIERKLHGRK